MTYKYDNADELTLVVEEASGTPVHENYTWYDDGALKTYPGPATRGSWITTRRVA